jgi:hypothetical protein
MIFAYSGHEWSGFGALMKQQQGRSWSASLRAIASGWPAIRPFRAPAISMKRRFST